MVVPALVGILTLQAGAPPKVTTKTQTGGWNVKRSVSAMDDSETVTLTLRARSPIRAWPATVATPSLIVRCKEGAVEAYIHTGAQASVEANDEATFTMRFDKLDPFETVLGESTDGVAFFFRDPKGFIREAGAHGTLLVRFTPFNSAPQETSFAVLGLRAAAQPLARACKWDPAADDAAMVAKEKAEDDRIAELATRLLNLEEPYQRRLLAAYDLNLVHLPVPATTIAALTKALLDDPAEPVRRQAATTLGKLGRGHQAARDALTVAAQTGTPFVVQKARNALTQLEGGKTP